ncbi:FAD-dependent oxidoreductase [Nevskia sp.]|uniref:NAD(P)/FAD-dependent oxidoreductase n=1 Tax=Nevskia sp. TaxID=1929292 RepID=UPI0025FF4286|nr:FAD-dependent oxidoreductase [Nevskia sp.]
MDLKSGYPFWAVKNGLMKSFPALTADTRCDVLIVGGGITAALIAQSLADDGQSVVVIEQRDIGWGSSAASTALLQYEIDTHMTELASRYGEDNAVLAYRACADAIPQLQELAATVRDVDFARMHSLYFASSLFHVGRLNAEYELRQRHGFAVSLLKRGEIREQYGFSSAMAIFSELAGRIDPYRLTYRLLMRLEKRGVSIFDRTRLESFEASTRGVVARTADGITITAGHLVFAAGYASQQYLDTRVARNRSSYAFITDPIDKEALGPLAETMVWESARPYLYMRSTGDGRLLIGGEDDDIDIPLRRDASVDRKAGILRKRVAKLFPNLPLQPTFAWAGTFAETDDGLPFFGPHPQHGPRVQFAMAYGGNGITFSAAGAALITKLIRRESHPLAALFSFDRLHQQRAP